MSKIYEDKHSLYLKANGSYYRPILPVGHQHLSKTTKIKKGDNIKTKVINGSCLLKINSEHWYVHGCYLTEKNSEKAFKPNQETW